MTIPQRLWDATSSKITTEQWSPTTSLYQLLLMVDAENYGIKIDVPQRGFVTLANGTILHTEEWLQKTDQQKADIATGGWIVKGDLAYSPTGEIKTKQSIFEGKVPPIKTKDEPLATPPETPGEKLAREQFEYGKQQDAEALRQWNIAQSDKRREAEWKAYLQKEADISNKWQAEAKREAGLWEGQSSGDQYAAEELAGQRLNQLNQEYAHQFEDMRSEILGMAGPRDWVTAWKAKTAINPYIVPTVGGRERPASDVIAEVKESLGVAQREEKNAKASYEAWHARETDDADVPNDEDVTLAKQRYNTATAIRVNLEDRLRDEQGWNAQELAYAQPRELATGGWAVGQPSGSGTQVMATRGVPNPSFPGEVKSYYNQEELWADYPEERPKPELPSDIQQFVSGGKWGGSITTPSGQSWARTPWSTRERLWGYGESNYLKPVQYPQDILNQMEMMQPYTPYTPSSWSPNRQRT